MGGPADIMEGPVLFVGKAVWGKAQTTNAFLMFYWQM
jgi:hypothetical protein